MDGPFGLGAPVRASLFEAAGRIDAASRTADGRWREGAAEALKLASSAVEAALDDLAGSSGSLHGAAREEPRLIPRLQKVEEALSAVLVDVWEAAASASGQPSPAFAARLAGLAAELRDLAGATFDLAHAAAEDSPPASD